MTEIKKDENTQLVERTEITGTPFTVVKVKPKEYMLTMGNYILLNDFKSFAAAKKAINPNNWYLILSMMNAVNHFSKLNKNE